MYTLAIVLGVLLQAIAAGASQLPKKPRFQHTMEIFDGQLCVFGGKSTTTGTNISDFLLDYRCVDVTKPIDQASPKWQKQSSASQFAMPPLAQHTSVYDRVNHVIVPFGGQSPVGFSKAIRLAVYCTLYQAWGASNVTDHGLRRYSHTVVLQEKSGDMVIFGGVSDNTTAGGETIGEKDGTRWLKVNRLIVDDARHIANEIRLGRAITEDIKPGKILADGGEDTPSNISGIIHPASVLVNDTQLVILGGDVYRDKNAAMPPLDLLYIYDLDTMKWRTQECTGDIPPSRSVLAASLHERHIYIHGGVNVTNPNGYTIFFGDLYELDTWTWAWRKMPTPNAPAPRYAHQMKTLGDYLIITHGFVQLEGDSGTGDPDIYFYDLNQEAFVDRYSPDGISKFELDTEWRERRTAATTAVAVICHLLTILVAVIAVYYLVFICRDLIVTRARPRPRRASNREGGIRSIVESYTETLRPSGYFGSRPSQEGNLIFGTRRSLISDGKPGDSNNARSHSMSEGTTTVIESEQTNALGNTMRHARILDESDGTPYVTRKLTLSANLPTYRARRSTAQQQMVRFSGCSENNTPSLRSEELDEPIELLTVDSNSDGESLDEILSPLQVANPEEK
ncbi:hypothetical protein H4R23_002479 [Coemansia sp. Cherry 401B]|nr:hypothetical protein H4R23_002479 [Coemansia sp. Cherry 401B]